MICGIYGSHPKISQNLSQNNTESQDFFGDFYQESKKPSNRVTEKLYPEKKKHERIW